MSGERRRDSRQAVGLLVRFKHPDVASFVQRFATNISPGGMFILSRQPKEVGTLVRFEVQIAGGVRVMRGEAEVRWIRAIGDPGGPAGMGLEFLRLDAPTQAILARMLEVREGLGPNALAEGGSARAPEAKAAPEAEPEAPAEVPAALATEVEAGIPEAPAEVATEVEAPAAPAVDPAHFNADSFEVDLALDDDVDLSVDIELGAEDEAPPAAPAYVWLTPPEELPTEGPIIGIDLGTTNSCVAVVTGERAQVIRSPEGYHTIPSVMALGQGGRLLVGHPAKAQMLTNPDQTVYGAKRLVGRAFESPTVRMVRDRFHYEICADAAGRAAVRLGEHVLSMEEAQGLILRACREMAEQHLGVPVHRAVVTVPAYYSDVQRQAVREAGRLSGLRVERILNEPTAAALAYGLNRGLRERVVIYDLGGGTFDVTAMAIEGNVFEVLATGGDTFLGGVDFDNQIVDWLLDQLHLSAGAAFDGDPISLARVAEAAESAKIALSESLHHDVFVPYLQVDGETSRDLECTLDREVLDGLTAELVDRSLDVVRDVLLDAQLKPGDVDRVLLVGGQSRSTLVRQRLGAFFGREAHPGVHADEAVAIGAALLAGSLDHISSVVLVDVLPMTLGVGLPGGRFKRIVERNTPLPIAKTYSLATSRDNQSSLEFSIFQGEGEHVDENEYLGALRIEGLPKRPRGEVRVGVTFTLGPDCILDVQGCELSSGAEVSTRLATRGTSEDLRRRLGIDEDLAKSVGAGRAAELERRGGRFWQVLRRMVGRAA